MRVLLKTAALLASLAVGLIALTAPIPAQDRAVLLLLMTVSYLALVMVLTGGIQIARLVARRLRRASAPRPPLRASASLALAGFLSLVLLSQLSVVFCYRDVVRLRLPPLGRLPLWLEVVVAIVAVALPFLFRGYRHRVPGWANRVLTVAAIAGPLVVLAIPPHGGSPIERTAGDPVGMPERPHHDRKASPVILVCLDGLDQRLLDAARGQVELPAFDRLRREGLVSSLDNEDYGFSPVVWNAVSTGTPVAQHGISDFYTRRSPLLQGSLDLWWKEIPKGFGVNRVFDVLGLAGLFEDRVARGSDRRGPSLWQLLSDQGYRSLVVNYLQSYPAERIQGVFVAWNLYWQLVGQERRGDHIELVSRDEERSGFTYPADVVERHLSGPDALKPQMVGGELLEQSGDEFRFLSRLTLRLAAEQSFDVVTFYSAWPDVFNHRYTVEELEQIREGRFETSRARAFLGMCQEVDAFLQRLRELMPQANMLVLSDHGVDVFYIGKRRAVHHQEGVPGLLLGAGPDVRPADAPPRVAMYDLAPTVLHYFGLPLDNELHGRVQRALLDNPAPIRSVEGWRERVGNPRIEPREEAEDSAIRERLRAVGYIE